MKMRVVTWNAEGMFAPYRPNQADGAAFRTAQTRRATPHDALATIRQLNADIIVVPEFGTQGNLDNSTKTALIA